jgi:hypothetical protein
METQAMLIFAGLVAHAWISKVQGPPQVVNAIAWAVGAILTVLVLIAVIPWPR